MWFIKLRRLPLLLAPVPRRNSNQFVSLSAENDTKLNAEKCTEAKLHEGRAHLLRDAQGLTDTIQASVAHRRTRSRLPGREVRDRDRFPSAGCSEEHNAGR